MSSSVSSIPSSRSSSSLCDAYAFFLNHINGVANRAAITLPVLITGQPNRIIMGNYMIELDWLYATIPALSRVARIDFIFNHGLGEDSSTGRPRTQAARSEMIHPNFPNAHLFSPSLPIEFGVHHSKFALLFYSSGIRVVVCTANFIQIDWKFKNNAVYVQDFPLKDRSSPKSSEFEEDLLRYMSSYYRTGLSVTDLLRQYDFSTAKGLLIGSTPGRHYGNSVAHFGHMKLRTALDRWAIIEEESDQQGNKGGKKKEAEPIVAQFSSLGSVNEKWLMQELRQSMAVGKRVKRGSHTTAASSSSAAAASSSSHTAAAASTPLQPASSFVSPSPFSPATLPPLRLIWPTVAAVRGSIEGYAAGGSLCCDSRNQKDYFRTKGLLRVWDGRKQGRHRAMPHIKSYLRTQPPKKGDGDAVGSGSEGERELAWSLITSANLSQAAWGQLQLQSKQLQIRHYELGVLFTPSHYAQAMQRIKARGLDKFSCTPDKPIRDTPLGKSNVEAYYQMNDPVGGAVGDAAASSGASSSSPSSSAMPTAPNVRFILLPPLDPSSAARSSSSSSSSSSMPSHSASSDKSSRSSGDKRKRDRDDAIDLTEEKVGGGRAKKHAKHEEKVEPVAAAAAPRSSPSPSPSPSPTPTSASSTTVIPSSSQRSGPLTITVACPIPYDIDAPLYGASDEPWTWDQTRLEPDVHGVVYLNSGELAET